MSAYASNEWGSTDSNDKACLGLWFYETGNTATSYTFRADAWIWTKWSIHDSDNDWYWDRQRGSAPAATTKYSSRDIYTTVSSGSAWSESNQQKIDSGTYTYTKEHSWYYVYIRIWLGRVAGCGNMAHNGWIGIPPKDSWTVSYNANGGSGAPGGQTKWYGETLTLSGTKPTRTGYSFQGWNTASNGTGTNYASGGSYTANSGTTLYAKWKANTYSVSYNANGGSGAPGAQTKTYSVDLTLSTTKPTRTGYTFSTWNTAAAGNGTNYSSGGKYTANAAVTLYAKWVANSYTVTFDANGGSSTTTKAETYNANYALPSNPTRTGYDFAGWFTAASGGSQVTTSTKVTTASNHTLYAHWTAHPYTVVFNKNHEDATGTMANESFTYDTAKNLTANAFTRANYAFRGWATSSTGAKVYNDGQSVSNLTATKNGTVNLYAVWEATYIPPVIQISDCYRCTSGGLLADDGPNLRVAFSWAIDSTVSGNAGVSYAIQKKIRGSDDSQYNVASNTINTASISGVSGQLDLTMTNAALEDEKAYDIRVVVTDQVGSNAAYDFISIAYFTVDFRSGGHGIAFGCSANKDDTLRSAMNTEFMGRNLSSANFRQETPLSTSTTPTANAYSNGFYIYSTGDDSDWCYTRATKLTDGRQGMQLETRRAVDGAWKYNTINLFVDESGNRSVTVSDAAAWRNALGILNYVYPVGSIYMSVNSTSPATLFGGTWEQLQNRFLLGAGTSYSNGATGGEASVSYTPGGTIGNTTLTVNQIPSHQHGVVKWKKGTTTTQQNVGWYSSDAGSGSKWQILSGSDGNQTYDCGTTATGGSKAHNHGWTGTKATIATMPPYLVVYMWKRTG